VALTKSVTVNPINNSIREYTKALLHWKVHYLVLTLHLMNLCAKIITITNYIILYMSHQVSCFNNLSSNHSFIATYPSDHSHFCLQEYHLIFFPYRPGLTYMQHTTSHTTAVQLPSHNQRYISIGEQWYQLPKFILSNSNSGLHSCIRISIHTRHPNSKTYLLTPTFHWNQYPHLCILC